MRAVEAGRDRLIDERVGLRRLLGDDPDGALKDVAVPGH